MGRSAGAVRSITREQARRQGGLGAVQAANTTAEPMSPELRHRMISEAAYHRAERRAFEGGDEDRLADWLAAERDIDAQLGTGRP